MPADPRPFAAPTIIGEAFAGSGPNAAHINVVIGRKGGPVETAWATALATPRTGYIPFLTVLRPNLPVKPMTLFVNKADLRGDTHSNADLGPGPGGRRGGRDPGRRRGPHPGRRGGRGARDRGRLGRLGRRRRRARVREQQGRRPTTRSRPRSAGSRPSGTCSPRSGIPGTPTTTSIATSAHHPDPRRAARATARPAVPRGLGPRPADVVRGDPRPGRDRRGRHGHRLGRHDGRLRGVRAPVPRRGPAAHRAPRPRARDDRVPRRPLLAARGRALGPHRQGDGAARGGPVRRARRTRSRRMPRRASAARRTSGPRPRSRSARRASGR